MNRSVFAPSAILLVAAFASLLPGSGLARDPETNRTHQFEAKVSIDVAVPESQSPEVRSGAEETWPYGIDLLVCVAGAKLSGATFSEAMSQCSARVP